MRKVLVAAASVLCLTLVAAAPGATVGGSSAQFPTEIDLPDGYFPEGIAIGQGSTFFVGSLADGSIYRGDLRTGAGAVFTDPAGQFATVGLDVDHRNRVWVAGGVTGAGRVYDGATGELLVTYQFTEPLQSLVNDVIVTADAAWFTDSGTEDCDMGGLCFIGAPRLFKVALAQGGGLPDPGTPAAVTEFPVDVPDIYFSNLNGIETMPGFDELILVHNQLGGLYRFDPATGNATILYGPPMHPPLQGADGMSRLGRTLYVVENGASRISEIRLDPSASTATLHDVHPVPGAQTPTTSALFGSAIYTVDARLGTPFIGPYKVFQIPR